MVLASLISSYRLIILKDGKMTRNELIEALELDNELSPEYKTKEQISNIADEILFNKSKEEVPKKNRKEKEEERLALYNQGLNDYEIADIQRISQSTVYQWRKKNGLKKNPAKINPKFAERMRLYELGYTDCKIGKLTDYTSTTIYMWRKKNKLPSKNKRPMKRQRFKNV